MKINVHVQILSLKELAHLSVCPAVVDSHTKCCVGQRPLLRLLLRQARPSGLHPHQRCDLGPLCGHCPDLPRVRLRPPEVRREGAAATDDRGARLHDGALRALVLCGAARDQERESPR